VYLVGTVSSDYRFSPGEMDDLANVREVKWDGEVHRDRLKASTRNSLGSTLTLFLLSEDAAIDVEAALKSPRAPT
jgi:restriction system protein